MSRHSYPRSFATIPTWWVVVAALAVLGVFLGVWLSGGIGLDDEPTPRPTVTETATQTREPDPAPTVTVTKAARVTETPKPAPTVTRTATPKAVPSSAEKKRNAVKAPPTVKAPTTAVASASVDAPAAATTTPRPKAVAPTPPVPTRQPVAPPTGATAEPDTTVVSPACVPGKRGNMTLTVINGVEHYGPPNSC